MTMSLLSAAGHKKMAAIVGMAIFPQFWYWYPEAHFISLAFSPTAVIGLNADLKMPKPFTFTSSAKPSLYAYPPPVEMNVEKEKKQVKKATLSVAKAKARANKKKDAMDTSEDKDAKKEGEEDKNEEEKKTEEKKEEKKPEPEFEILSNPARVTFKQRLVVSFSQTEDSRYIPVKKVDS